MHWLAIWRVDCSVVVCDVAFAPLLSFIELFLRQYVDSTHFVLNSFTWSNALLLDLEIEEISPSKTRWVAYLAIFVAKSERFLRRNMITSFFARILAVIQHFDHVVAEERVLELSLHNAICAEIVLDTVDVRLCSNLLNLAKFWLIFACHKIYVTLHLPNCKNISNHIFIKSHTLLRVYTSVFFGFNY